MISQRRNINTMSQRLLLLLSLTTVAMALPHMELSLKNIERIPKMIKTKADLIDFVTERKYRGPNAPVKLTHFAFKDCGGPKALVNIHSVMVGPDPVVLPGPLKVSASITVKKTLDSPLVGNVTVQKKIGSKYVEIPCIDDIGSCHYDDLCDLLSMATCPDALEKIGIDCMCPLFKPQNYMLPMTTFDINFGPLPSGDYHFIGAAIYQDMMGACIDMVMTFQ